MDLAQTLLRSVMRAFYETRQILVIDALIVHSALRDEDLVYIMKMNPKDLQKLCAKLRNDRFMTQHVRPEIKEGMQRPVNRTWYYIDYRQAIDAIKWRVYTITKDVQGSAAPVSEKKEYYCPRCKAEWTLMDVLDNSGPQGFLCHRCDGLLTHDLERISTGHEKSTRLNNQLKFITDLLPRIDNVRLIENTFDEAISNARPVIRDAAHPGNDTIPINLMPNRPTAVRGMANTGPTTMSVSISASDGPTDAERVAEAARRERMAAQNALPSWMANSTVTGESFTGSGPPVPTTTIPIKVEDTSVTASTTPNSAAAAAVVALPSLTSTAASIVQDSAAVHSFDASSHHANVDEYFERLKRQAAEEEAKRQNDEDDDDDEFEDDDDFEDVLGSQQAAAVPAAVAAVAVPLTTTTNITTTTTTTTTITPVKEDRLPKRVRVDEPPKPVKKEEADDDEESDEDVFEDV